MHHLYDKPYVSALSRARRLGSAHEGTHHWLAQRVTALSNLLLVSWVVVSFVMLRDADYAVFTAWLEKPWNAALLILAIVSTYYHAVLGCQVVAEDYIGHKWLMLAKIIALKLFFTAIAVASIFSVLKIAL